MLSLSIFLADDPVFWDRVLLSQDCSSLTKNMDVGAGGWAVHTRTISGDTNPGQDVCPIGGVKRKQEVQLTVSSDKHPFKRIKSQ